MLRLFALAALVLAASGPAAAQSVSGMPAWFDASRVDSLGNPVFNSFPFADTTLAEFELVANYYAVGGNIDDPASSVFMAEEPTLEQYARFAVETPSYFFVVAVGDEARALVSLWQLAPEGAFRYVILTPDPADSAVVEAPYTFSPSDLPVMTEVRLVELSRRGLDPELEPVQPGRPGRSATFNGQLHHVLPFHRVFEDVIALVRERRLYE